jgi:hypothetical protein
VPDDADPPLGAWERHLCAPLAGRKVICAFEVLAAMARMPAKFRRWGTEHPLLIADGIGTGPVPTGAEADVEMMEPTPSASLTEQVRARMRPASRLTPGLVAAVERYDPAGTAAWWVSPVAPNTPLLRREVFGGRPPAQAALEDKVIVDQILDDSGVAHAPSVISEATYDALMRATAQILQQSGGDQVVWAGDSRDGINGAGDYVRWIRHQEHALDAAVFFSHHCDRVRVSPFLEGVPCSIHAIVLPDGVVVFRPVELASLLQPEPGRFFFGGMGTSWDPPESDRVQMRRVARQVGEHLQRSSGYRGALGLDGVLTVDGFSVTELNPRFSGGLSRLARAAEDAQLELVQMNALIGRDIGRAAAELESLTLELLDEARFVGVMGMSSCLTVTETVEVAVTAGVDQLEIAADDDEAVGLIQLGPSELGAFARMTISEDVIQRGDRCAPFGVLLCEFADRQWGTGFGPMTVAPNVRPFAAGA